MTIANALDRLKDDRLKDDRLKVDELRGEQLNAWRWGMEKGCRNDSPSRTGGGRAGGLGQKDLLDLFEALPRQIPTAADFPHVHPDQSLHLALERMGSSGLQVIPVVSRANIRELLGVVVLDDILLAYGVNRTAELLELPQGEERKESRHGKARIRIFKTVVPANVCSHHCRARRDIFRRHVSRQKGALGEPCGGAAIVRSRPTLSATGTQ